MISPTLHPLFFDPPKKARWLHNLSKLVHLKFKRKLVLSQLCSNRISTLQMQFCGILIRPLCYKTCLFVWKNPLKVLDRTGPRQITKRKMRCKGYIFKRSMWHFFKKLIPQKLVKMEYMFRNAFLAMKIWPNLSFFVGVMWPPTFFWVPQKRPIMSFF